MNQLCFSIQLILSSRESLITQVPLNKYLICTTQNVNCLKKLEIWNKMFLNGWLDKIKITS